MGGCLFLSLLFIYLAFLTKTTLAIIMINDHRAYMGLFCWRGLFCADNSTFLTTSFSNCKVYVQLNILVTISIANLCILLQVEIKPFGQSAGAMQRK